ncbi:MAG: hypothetical protein WBG71_14720 [Leeuwenhoekiella sp.]
MDELELLKKDWKLQDASITKVSDEQIYEMSHARSSSLTQWILIVSVAEFVFWTAIYILFPGDQDQLKDLHLYKFNLIATVIHYVILLGFIYVFFRNYKRITTTDSARKLMKKILKVRRTVNLYIIYNLIVCFVVVIVTLLALVLYDPEFNSFFINSTTGEMHIAWKPMAYMIGMFLIIITLFWLFYKLLYGFLLGRLKRNYKRLTKLDIRE